MPAWGGTEVANLGLPVIDLGLGEELLKGQPREEISQRRGGEEECQGGAYLRCRRGGIEWLELLSSSLCFEPGAKGCAGAWGENSRGKPSWDGHEQRRGQ